MKIFGLTFAEISIIVSLLTTFIVLLVKFIKWLTKLLINYHTKQKFLEIHNNIQNIENIINKISNDIQLIKEDTPKSQTCIIKHKEIDLELEKIDSIQKEIEALYDLITEVKKTIDADYSYIYKRLDDFILTFIQRK